jgi:predicted phosphodiesterase
VTKEKDETKPKKKRKLKWQVKLFLLILFIIIYAFFIGPKGIFIKDYNIKTSKISNLSSGIKILQISDIYYGSTINKSDIKKIVKKINENNVDVVIFTGDLISKNYDITDEDKTFLKKWLNKIDTELGKYYTTGEEDFEDTNEILGMAGFTNLNNNPQSIYDESNTPIIIMDKSINKEYLERKMNRNFRIFKAKINIFFYLLKIFPISFILLYFINHVNIIKMLFSIIFLIAYYTIIILTYFSF